MTLKIYAPTRLQGKVAVVTGASSGIGYAIVEQLVGEGAKVIAAGRSGKQFKLQEQYPGSVVAVNCEVSDETQVKAMIDTCIERFGRIDVLVNNAGITGGPGRFEEYDSAEWDKVFATNVKGTYLGIKHTVPHMLKQGGGSIIIVGSVASFVPAGGSAAYAPSKGALLQITKQAAFQYLHDNIRVNLCCPGLIDTPILDGCPGGLDALAGEVPLGRVGKVGEITPFIAYLASDESSYCTGASFLIDGGLATL